MTHRLSSNKRKTDGLENSPVSTKKAKVSSTASHDVALLQNLVDGISQDSRKYHDNFRELFRLSREDGAQRIAALTALCKAFCSLHLQGRFKRKSGQSSELSAVTDWLLERCVRYKTILIHEIFMESSAEREIALRLIMLLIQAEVQSNHNLFGTMSTRGAFHDVVAGILKRPESSTMWAPLISSYLVPYIDLRYLFLRTVVNVVSSEPSGADQAIITRAVSLLAQQEEKYTSEPRIEDGDKALFFPRTRNFKAQDLKKLTGEAWLCLMGQVLTIEQRRQILNLIPSHIEPNVTNPGLLLDFLTDCCDTGGAEAIMALEGLYRLIADYSLDYPLLYHKLYVLLDTEILHKRYRSRFLRLVNTFLTSTHLPAVLVASFIKRLSRLALHAPPAAIVAIVPLVYNLLQGHPACTPMLHRRATASVSVQGEHSFDDPFDMDEPDPNLTEAIKSSIWELDTLKNHWHPNVATITKILAEQFLKRSYNIEDFLDHSYGSLIDTEVSKNITKPPALEYVIPKRLFTHDSGHDRDADGMNLWHFD